MSELFYPREPDFKFGAYLRLLREQRGLTMQDVVNRSEGNLSHTSLSVIERDRSPSIPSPRLLGGLSKALELPLGYLFMLAYISDKGLEPSQVDRVWEEFELSHPVGAGHVAVPRFQQEPMGLDSEQVSFYTVDKNVRITFEASLLNMVVPNDVIAVDERAVPQPGALALGRWPEEHALVLFRQGVDTEHVLVQARKEGEAHHVLGLIAELEPLGSVVWRCGRIPS